MITLQHSLITLYAKDGKEEETAKEIPYVLLPDAIRKYSSLRQYGHFEKDKVDDTTSWLRYPIGLKKFNESEFKSTPKHLSQNIRLSALGEEIDIESFDRYNMMHLPTTEYTGIKKHLLQDKIFDEWIRKQIDCSKRDEGIYLFQGKRYNGGEIRKIIAEIECQGVYILAYMNYKTYGITTDQEWFDNCVKKQLDISYPKELSDKTYGYMKIPEHINKRIREHDWSKLEEGIIPVQEYVKMYKRVAMEMLKIDIEKKKSIYEKQIDAR